VVLDDHGILSVESVAMLANAGHILPGNTPEAAQYKDYHAMHRVLVGLGWWSVLVFPAVITASTL
jgi:hypothetical protein